MNEAYHRIAEKYKNQTNGEAKKSLKTRKPSVASSSNSEPIAGPSTSWKNSKLKQVIIKANF